MPDTTPQPKPREPKNPARVDAALRTHLRRMDRDVRTNTIFVIATAAVALFLFLFHPLRPKLTFLAACFMVVVTILGTMALTITRKRREETRGKLLRTCRTCGYDLRATHDRCPECNTPIPEALRLARDAGKDRQFLRTAHGH